MRMQLLYKTIWILLFFPVWAFAQPAAADIDITGLWKGSLYNDTTQQLLPYEIAISEEKGKFTGYSYTLFDINGKKELGVKKIKIKRKDDKLIIEDVSLIANTYSAPPPKGVRFMGVVNLSSSDTVLQLDGRWSTSPTREYLPITGTMRLKRTVDFRPQVLYKKLEELHLDGDLSFVLDAKRAEQDIAKQVPAAVPKVPDNLPAQEPDAAQPIEMEAAPLQRSIPAEAATLIPVRKMEVATIIEPTRKKTRLPAEVTKKAVLRNIEVATNLTDTVKKAPIIAVKEPQRKEVPTLVVAKQSTPAVKPVVAVKPAPQTKAPAVSAPVPVKKEPVDIAKVPAKEPVKAEVKETIKTPAPPVKEVVKTVADHKKAESPVNTNSSPAAADVAARKISNTQEVFFRSDSLILTLYDNGDVDGDTVSVLMNGTIMFSRQGLTTRANSKTIYITPDTPDSILLVMYAENLGSIPPNTGLLVVRDGEAVYDVRFRADLQSNAAIILRRKKE